MIGAARALIDTSALRDNFARARAAAPGKPLIAAIKADGYGHGLLRVARALADADGFGVARLDEALRLRAAGFEQRIVLLEGPFEAEQVARAQAAGLDVVIHDASQLPLLADAGSERPLTVWIKVDSGMHRLGFAPQEVAAVREALEGVAAVAAPVGFMTHLASADEPDVALTERQIAVFHEACGRTRGPRSIANSAGLLGFPASHADWPRPGIMLYGASPFVGRRGSEHGLRPAMHFVSQLISVKPLARGEPVGYGGTWRAPRDTRIGVVAVGYGDGYPRHAPNRTPVTVGGRRVPLVGRVSMDMLTVDLGPEASDRVGDPVVLWGDDPLVEEVAEAAGTIAYELLCGVTGRVVFEELEPSQRPESVESVRWSPGRTPS